jgi:hypothetical protein
MMSRIDDIQKTIIALQVELEAEKKKAAVWPKKHIIYFHASDDEWRDEAEELGLSEFAQDNYGPGYEVTVNILVNEDGTTDATHFNGMPLKEKVRV